MNDRAAFRPAALPAGPPERFAYSYAVRTGEILWISGMVALDAQGEIVGVDDIDAQATQVFENLKAVLAEAGGTLADVVSTTTYMTDRAYSLPINDVRVRYFVDDPRPTSTLLVVAGLARPEFLVEVEAVAVVRGG